MKSVKNLFLLSVLSLVMSVIGPEISCAAGTGVFDSLAEDTTSFAVSFRNFAYVISGFGIIMFTFLAVGGKINFKHLGYIVLCLFMLSAVGSLIVYFTDGAPKKVGLQLEGGSGFGQKYQNAGKGKFEGNSSI